MAKLTVHYEGWVALPAEFRRRLRIAPGDKLEAELVDGTIVIRAAGTKVEEEPAPAEAAPMEGMVPEPPALATQVEATPAPKRRGRPPKAKG